MQVIDWIISANWSE